MGNVVTEEFISRAEALEDFESCNAHMDGCDEQ